MEKYKDKQNHNEKNETRKTKPKIKSKPSQSLLIFFFGTIILFSISPKHNNIVNRVNRSIKMYILSDILIHYPLVCFHHNFLSLSFNNLIRFIVFFGQIVYRLYQGNNRKQEEKKNSKPNRQSIILMGNVFFHFPKSACLYNVYNIYPSIYT